MERNPGYRLSHHASLGFSQSRKDVISAATSCQCPVGTLQKQTDMHHAFVRLVELWRKFEEILDRWARTEIGAHAGAADGLFRLEEARFLPVLARFFVVLKEHGRPCLWEQVEEFVKTSMKLTEQIEVWLREVGRRG